MLSKIVICVIEHAKFGWILAPYFKENASLDSYFNANKKVLSLSQVDESIYPFEKEREILKIFEEINDQTIHKLFDKKKTSLSEYFKNIKNEFILNHIKPYIELRILKIIQLIPETRFKIFLKSKKYNNIYLSDEIKIQDSKSSAIFNFIRSNEGIRYYLSIDSFKLTHQNPIFLTNSPCSLILHKKFYNFQNIDSKKLQPFLSKEFIFIPQSAEKKYFETFVTTAIKNFNVNNEGFDIANTEVKKQAIISLEKDLNSNPIINLKFNYGEHSLYYHNQTKKLVQFKYAELPCFNIIRRDFNWEKKIKTFIEELGLINLNNSSFYLNKDYEGKDSLGEFINWININYDAILENNIQIEQNFYKQDFYLKPFKHEIEIQDSSDWFDIYGKIYFDEFEIPFIALKHNILNKIKEYELPNGQLFIIPDEWFSKYTDIFKFAQFENDRLQLKKIHFQLIEKNINGIEHDLSERIKDLNQENINFNYEVPDSLNASLRSYQKEGYQWMRFLNKNDFGGCLADDMGLGKTIQTIALILSQGKEINTETLEKSNNSQLDLFTTSEKTTIKIPSLIIVPSSLIDNWINEVQKFAPSLKIKNYTGTSRDSNNFSHFDIVLSTYGIVRNESTTLSSILFHYIVLDESQIIKNPNSKIYRSVKELQSNHKIVLTGTPIENSLSDLWSQFNFFNEGLLGNFNFFKQEFLYPIEKLQDEEAKTKLQNLIKPFILRRTKEQVEKDLPELTEQIIYCPMTENQASIYDEEKSKIRNYIFENIGNVGIAKSSIHILQGLTKLRQLANHPRMTEELYLNGSGKFDEIIRNMQNVLDEGHKLLIFSSFVKHLEIFEEYFNSNEINYSKLTGESTRRGKIVDEFQNSENIKVFLI
jgi:SNF2 family DNA or RNA helicase